MSGGLGFVGGPLLVASFVFLFVLRELPFVLVRLSSGLLFLAVHLHPCREDAVKERRFQLRVDPDVSFERLEIGQLDCP